MVLILWSFSTLAMTQLTLWHSWVENLTLWQQIESEFNNSHQNIKLKVVAFNHEEMKQSIIKSSFKRNSADMVLMPSDWLGYNNVMHFSTIPKNIISSAVSPSVIEQSRFDQKIRGIPLFQGNHLLFMFNKALVKKPVSTWRELINERNTWLSQNIKPLAINYNESYWFVPFISAFGGFPVNKNQITLNTAATINALKYYKQLATLNVVDNQCSYKCVSEDFYAGKFAYSMAGAWAYKTAKKALGDNLGIMLFPTMNNREFKPMRGNLILAFPKNSLAGLKHHALLEFIQFIQQEKYQRLMFEQSNVFPVNHNVMKEIMKNSSADFKLSVKQFNHSNNMPASTSISAVWNGLLKGFSLYMQDELSAEQAAAYMQKSVEHQQKILNRKDYQ